VVLTLGSTFRCRNFLRQKSVSATREGIRGGDPSFPIVYGNVDGASPKTLIVCGMYDVQPAEETQWMSPPFAAEIHNLPGLGECVIARGAVNSEGAFCGVFNALRAIRDVDEIPLNIIFTVEGEEEIASHQFKDFLYVVAELEQPRKLQ